MSSIQNPSTAFADSKKHYLVLDGLRGVSAVIIVFLHILEPFANGSHIDLMLNHGYLAVDFFFALSGFVLGYAYDDRWQKMSVGDFFKRRLIRLHPLIIVGMLIGAGAFYFSASPSVFPLVAKTGTGMFLIVTLLGLFLIPIPVSMDIRGWAETFPLNGPAWTLFFEYVANILYALFLRKASNTILTLLAVITGGMLIHLAVTNPAGDLIGGWSLEPYQFYFGATRLLYPFIIGLLLSRTAKLTRLKNAFYLCSLLLVILYVMPRIGGSKNLLLNALYDSLTVVFLFPAILYMGASSVEESPLIKKACRFLGDISYPIYITHFPAIYIFTAWVANNKIALDQAWPVIILVVCTCFIVAYISLKFYDEPVRKWLTRRLTR